MVLCLPIFCAAPNGQQESTECIETNTRTNAPETPKGRKDPKAHSALKQGQGQDHCSRSHYPPPFFSEYLTDLMAGESRIVRDAAC